MVFVSDSSGRFTTSYIPQCVLNENLKKEVSAKDNYSYRQYLQKNAAKIMKSNMDKALNTTSPCCDCKRCILISKKEFFK